MIENIFFILWISYLINILRLTRDEYKSCLINNKNVFRNMQLFKSNLHNIYSQVLNKVALSSFDNKRFILDDKVNTLAWGHYKIPEILIDYIRNN
jgi:hypothetical protein